MSEFNYTEWMQQNKVGPYRKMNLRESGIGDLPFDFVKAAIESASGDQISGTEEDRNGRSMFRSAKNPNIVYYINNDEQITKHDSETGERYSIGNLRHYDEPTQDYEPDTDADYEEPEDRNIQSDYDDGEFWEGKKGDLSDYIVKNDDGKFYIDQEDPDTGEAVASPGDSFVFTYEGRQYKATVTNKDFGRNGVYLLRLAGEDDDVFDLEGGDFNDGEFWEGKESGIEEDDKVDKVIQKYESVLLKALTMRSENPEDIDAHDAVKKVLETIASTLGLDSTIPFMEIEYFSGQYSPKEALEYAKEMFHDYKSEQGPIDEAGNIKGITIDIPENTDYKELAKAVAKVLIEDYGQHNYKPFLQALIAELK